jgi:twitching motility protein PilT
VARYRDGLIVVSGPPASGRSATAAHLLSLIMAKRRRHVVTLEPRVEYAFEEGMYGVGPVTRHELHAGQIDLADAVGAALGEDPDVLFLAAEPDAAALRLLLDAAHSGVLVVIMLQARTAVAAIEYLRDHIPASEWPGPDGFCTLMVRAVFAQRLVPRVGGGRVAAYEILLGTPAVRNLINERRFDRLQACLETGRQIGMQTFAQHQSRLVVAGTVSADDARLDEL